MRHPSSLPSQAAEAWFMGPVRRLRAAADGIVGEAKAREPIGDALQLDGVEEQQGIGDRVHQWNLEQYKTLRQESLNSQSVQHSSLQWGIAITVGMLSVAAVLAAKQNPIPAAIMGIETLILGIAVPLVLLGSSLSWLGEVRRMVRAGNYVRWIEEYLRNSLKTPGGARDELPTLVWWEHSLSGHLPAANPGMVKGRDYEAYLGPGIVYGGGIFCSLLMWVSLCLMQGLSIAGHVIPQAIIVGYGVLAVLSCAGVMTWVALKRVLPLAS